MGILDYWKNIVVEKANAVNEASTAALSQSLTVAQILKMAILRKQKVEIDYQKADGTSSMRVLNFVIYSDEYTPYGSYIKGVCQLRGEERTFKVSRIRNAKIV